MPQGLKSDEYYNDIVEVFHLEDDPTFAEMVMENAKADPKSPIWGMVREGDYEGVVGWMYNDEADIPEHVFDEFLRDEIEQNRDIDEEEEPDHVVPDEPYEADKSFNTGAEYAGSLQIVESENEKVYVPSSYYCHTKVFNKFLELQGRGKDVIPLEAGGINPYAMTKTAFLNHVVKYMFKCDCITVDGEKKCKAECYIKKRKAYEDKKNGNDFYRENSVTTPEDTSNPENYCKPSICRVWWDKNKVNVKPINKAAQSHPKMCIGLIAIKGTDKCHAILIKDYHDLTQDDIIIHLSKTKELFAGFKKFKQYRYRDPKPYAVSWDIETWVHVVNHTCCRCKMIKKMEEMGRKSRTKKECTCKYMYKLNVAAIGYEIINIVERIVIQPCKIVFDFQIKEDDEVTLFDKFFLQLHEDCRKLNINDATLYAHNAGKFDNIFAKKSKVIKFDNEISNGNHIKSMNLVVDEKDYKLKLSMRDTLPFTLQSLKDACATFKTEICKEEFDIINKSRKWYCMNRDKDVHKRVMENDNLINEYIHDYLDIHMKCNYQTEVQALGNGKFTCKEEFADAGKKAKEDELEDIKTFKDWAKYLTYDVRSLTNLIFNVDAMYNDFGFSITNYVGLPGIAMDMMNSYCYNLSKLYVPSDPSMVELCHASIKGGRVLHFKDRWDSPIKKDVKWDDDAKNYKNIINHEITQDIYEDYLICIDMNSLYPSAMFACGFPVGKPELVPKDKLEDFNKYPHYLGEFEVTIPNIRYPIHPYKSDKGALLYPSNQTVIDVYNDVDVREMMKDGYKVKMRKGIYWKKSAKIFSELINMIFNTRNKYKSLNPDDPDYNKEYICKILMNAMFGKYNETIKSLVRFFTGDEEEMKKNTDKKSRVTKMENGQYRISETLKTPRISKPTYIAGYVTAYSRAICNEIFRAVGPEKIYYSDTDSAYLKFSDFNNANLKCSNGLCGFKNDYGDGVMITKARFLDIKRCYFEFRTRVDTECFDKWGKHRLSCKDPITKEVNKKDPYYVKTFKFKYTGINFKDIVSSSVLEPDNKLYSTEKSYEVYNKIMENTSKIVDKFIENNKKNVGKKTQEYDNIQFIMKRFKKDGHSVTINLSEFAFSVSREKRGQWIDDEFYALGYDLNKPPAELNKTGAIGDLVKKFSKYTKCNYGFMTDEGRKFLKSRRPLFYNIRMHIELIKEKSEKYPKKITSANEYIIEYNKSTSKSEYVQKIFDEYLKYTEDVKAGKIEFSSVTNGKYCSFLNGLMNVYINTELKKKVNALINNDVIIDRNKQFDTDYYIEFYDEITDTIKYDNYQPNKMETKQGYRILNKMKKYAKEDQPDGTRFIPEYFIPNFINVKGRAENVNTDKLFPVMMLSTRFNKDLGNNNLDNWQTLLIVNNVI